MIEFLSSLFFKLPANERRLVFDRAAGWPAVRAQWLKDHPTCAACGRAADPRIVIVPHHVVPVHVDPSRELYPDNLISLCEPSTPGPWGCHFWVGHLGDWRCVNTFSREVAKDMLAAIQGRKR